MTIKEFVYDYFFPEGNTKPRKRDVLFKLAKRGTDISKKKISNFCIAAVSCNQIFYMTNR